MSTVASADRLNRPETTLRTIEPSQHTAAKVAGSSLPEMGCESLPGRSDGKDSQSAVVCPMAPNILTFKAVRPLLLQPCKKSGLC
jgi:hypothetical protein